MLQKPFTDVAKKHTRKLKVLKLMLKGVKELLSYFMTHKQGFSVTK